MTPRVPVPPVITTMRRIQMRSAETKTTLLASEAPVSRNAEPSVTDALDRSSDATGIKAGPEVLVKAIEGPGRHPKIRLATSRPPIDAYPATTSHLWLVVKPLVSRKRSSILRTSQCVARSRTARLI
jgi:hypothetical protein